MTFAFANAPFPHAQPVHMSLSVTRRHLLQTIPLALTVLPRLTRADIPVQPSDAAIDPLTNAPPITDRAYLDISLDNAPPRRVTIALYGTIVPATVQNFLRLCETAYADTPVYRIVPGLTVQLGDVLRNGGKSGLAATPAGTLPVENTRILHTGPGIVSMVAAKGLVDSRFFVVTRPGDSAYLDGKYVAFAFVEHGMDVFYDAERLSSGFVKRPVRVVATGLLPE